jgi:hypothetical protein
MNSASLCSLAGRYDNPIPTRFLDPIESFKIPAQDVPVNFIHGRIRQMVYASWRLCVSLAKFIIPDWGI